VREYGADVSRVSDAEADRERTLATILFTDIVDSTKWAAKLGDRQWRALLDRHDDAFAAMRQSVRVAPIGVKTIRVLPTRSLFVRLTKISWAPATAMAMAMARPLPRSAPVTSATLPSRRNPLAVEFIGLGLEHMPKVGSQPSFYSIRYLGVPGSS